MWNKRREDEAPKSYSPPNPAPVSPSITPAEPRKEPPPVSSMPAGKFDSEARGSAATIGKAVKINGQIHSREDLVVDGHVEGTLEAPEHKLTVGPHGTVHATVKAREVVVLGTIQGNVEATERIEIRKEAKLIGDIRTARIIIEDGAYFKGSIDIVKPDPAKSQAPKAQPAAAPAAAGTPVTSGAPEGKR